MIWRKLVFEKNRCTLEMQKQFVFPKLRFKGKTLIPMLKPQFWAYSALKNKSPSTSDHMHTIRQGLSYSDHLTLTDGAYKNYLVKMLVKGVLISQSFQPPSKK